MVDSNNSYRFNHVLYTSHTRVICKAVSCHQVTLPLKRPWLPTWILVMNGANWTPSGLCSRECTCLTLGKIVFCEVFVHICIIEHLNHPQFVQSWALCSFCTNCCTPISQSHLCMGTHFHSSVYEGYFFSLSLYYQENCKDALNCMLDHTLTHTILTRNNQKFIIYLIVQLICFSYLKCCAGK